MNDITIVITTWYTLQIQDRIKVLQEAVNSWINHFDYDGELRFHIADDGSDVNFIIGPEHTISQQYRKGVGASLNAGFKQAFKISKFAMYIVDDWILHRTIDLNPWIILLTENPSIGCVRLGPPHPGITGKCYRWKGDWFFLLDRHDYAFSMRPALYHKRFFDTYGWFTEGNSAVECERIYNEHFCSMEGPEIVYALPSFWEHKPIYILSEIEP